MPFGGSFLFTQPPRSSVLGRSQQTSVDGIMLVVERDDPLSTKAGGRRSRYAHLRCLMNWTDQGVKSAKETVQRRDQADTLAQKHGASIEQVYWTVGPYDLVVIVEAPDDESATAMLLKLGTGGNLRTTTLRAYDREEMSGIIQ
jgi:uncharacterized protein with GYD domain